MSDRQTVIYHGSPFLWKPEPDFIYGRPKLDNVGVASGQSKLLDGGAWYATNCKDNAKHYGSRSHTSSVLSAIARSSGLSEHLSNAVTQAYQSGMPPEDFFNISMSRNAKHSMAGCALNESISIDAVHNLWRDMKADLYLYSLSVKDNDLLLFVDADIPVESNSARVCSAIANLLVESDLSDSCRSMLAGDALRAIGRTCNKWEDRMVEMGVPGVVRHDRPASFRGIHAINYAIWDQSLLDRLHVLEVVANPDSKTAEVDFDARPTVNSGGMGSRIDRVSMKIGDSGAIGVVPGSCVSY